MNRSPQLQLLQKATSAYGGSLLKTRKGRERGRPLSTKHSMHFVLRSTHAQGDWRLTRKLNRASIEEILSKFSQKYGVKIYSKAINLNHIHLHLKISRRQTYLKFIRAVSSAIAMKITGNSRWNKLKIKFWDQRPFSRIVSGVRNFMNIKNYIEINQLEGLGVSRAEAIRDIQRWSDRQNQQRWRQRPS